MLDWLKKRTKSEKIMIGLIIMLLTGVIMRWKVVKKEGGDAIKHRVDMILQK